MKKSLVSILLGLFMVGVSGNVWAGKVVAADLECTNPAGCVQTGEISDSAVTEPKLAANAVTNGKIGDGAVTNSKLADWSVSGSKIVDFSITDTKISSNAITTSKIVDGSVTDAKITGPISGSKLGSHIHDGSDIIDGTITTSKISDGAITDAKIAGPISTSKLEKFANVVVVAKSGGDFTSIQAAIDSINPTAENPYLIKVMPGTYVENITMKSYIYLQGAGHDITTIMSPSISNPVVTIGDAIITDFTVKGGSAGIQCSNYTSSTITRNLIAGNTIGISVGISWYVKISDNIITGNSSEGISLFYMSESSIISGNIISDNGAIGISLAPSDVAGGPPLITGNTITGNGSHGIYIGGSLWYGFTITDNIISKNDGCGIYTDLYTAPSINGNIITENGLYGVVIIRDEGSWRTSTKLYSNRVTDNGGMGYTDIYLSASPQLSSINISFNIYDDISGNGAGVGLYNVKSDGSTAPEP